MRVLLVCRANVCRSRVGAALLAAPLAVLDADVTSAGVLAAESSVVCRYATDYVLGNSATVSTAPPRQLSAEGIEVAGLVLTVEREMTAAVAVLSPASRPRTFPLLWAAAAMQYIAGLVLRGEVPPGATPIGAIHGTSARWAWLVGEMDAARGHVPVPVGLGGDSGLDVLDPHTGEISHPVAFDRISVACRQIVDAARVIVEAPS